MDIPHVLVDTGSAATLLAADIVAALGIVPLPEDILHKVDASVQARRIKTPRHTWLLEAVLEKLEREST